MLGIEPLQLQLPFDLQNQKSWEVKLTNETNNYYAFIIELPCRQYFTEPDKGIVSPQSDCSIRITMQAQNTLSQVMPHTDKFIVKSTIVDMDFKVNHITQHFANKGSSEVDEVNLVVVAYNPKKSQGNASVEVVAKVSVVR